MTERFVFEYLLIIDCECGEADCSNRKVESKAVAFPDMLAVIKYDKALQDAIQSETEIEIYTLITFISPRMDYA